VVFKVSYNFISTLGGHVMTYESPIVQEVRERAMKISERFGHDLHKYCEYLRDQKKPRKSRQPDCRNPLKGFS
jgi:hypothetical protein